MKTAEEIVNKVCDNYTMSGIYKGISVEVVKAYGKQCAEQALKDAAGKFKGITVRYGNGSSMEISVAIESTPILTP